MNKREAEKLARDIAWKVCMLNEVPQRGDFEALEAYGWKLERRMIAGMDGIAVSSDAGETFIATPRKRNPGKKQTCTMYAMKDVEAYARACDALARDDYREAANVAATIEAASLRADIEEGMSHIEREMGLVEVSDLMEEANDLEAIRGLVSTMGEFEVWQKRPGCCVWVKGDTKPHKEELKAYGFKFSPKKQAWYWKPAA